MTRQAELLNIVDKLPPKYFGEVIDFAGYLQHKARHEIKPLSETSKNLTAQEAMERGLGLGTGSRIEPAEAVKHCSGIFKRLDIPLSSDDFLAMRQQEKELESRLDGGSL
ncbi:MAG: hypothetical protein FWG99_07285 [Treponema sp.]|nr:hypothetical protein [Treponema sp.]